MFQNPDSWLVLLSLAITVIGIVVWLREAGDDWLRRDTDGRWGRSRMNHAAEWHDSRST